MWIIINLQNYKILQKTNFKHIPNYKMLKPWINNCRDDLYGRLQILKSITSKIDARIEHLYNYQDILTVQKFW